MIAATNRPIARALAENRLRSDLYYRINTFQIDVPPLRERKQDIPPLVAFFVKQFAQQLGKSEPEIAPEVRKWLCPAELDLQPSTGWKPDPGDEVIWMADR